MANLVVSSTTTSSIKCYLGSLDTSYSGQRRYEFLLYRGTTIVQIKTVYDSSAGNGATKSPTVTFSGLPDDTSYDIICDVFNNVTNDLIFATAISASTDQLASDPDPDPPADSEWGWGDDLGTFNDSDYGTESLKAYKVDYLYFEAPSNGRLYCSVYDSSDDLVLYAAENGASWDDRTSPRYLVTYDYREDSTTSGYEEMDFKVYSGEEWEIGWYTYDGESATVDWEIIFEPEATITKWRCWDVDLQEHISPYDTNTEAPSTSSITRPVISGYTYLGYTNYANWPDCRDNGNSGNFTGTGTTSTGHNADDRDCLLFCYRKTPTISSWQTPQSITSISGATYSSSYGPASSTINAYNAGYVTYTTPAYRGKLVCKTTSSSASVDHYTHLSTSALSAGSGTARTTAVTGSILASDDNSAGGYNSQISYICAASTAYRWYINAAWASSGTTSVTWQLNYYREYSITYNVNGGSGSIASQTFYTDNLSVPLTTQVPTRTNYIFKGWATSSSATTPTYTSGQTASLSAANITLYAVWEQALSTYTITYNANGGSGAPSALNALQNTNVTIDTATTPTRTNYIFKGWATSSSATAPLYKKGEVGVINVTSNITLYAVWWPTFAWSAKNAVEGKTFNNLIVTYIGATGNSDLTSGNIYDVLWFNNIAAKVKYPSKVSGDFITDADLKSLVEYYKNY